MAFLYLDRTHSRKIIKRIVAVTQIVVLEGDLDATLCIMWSESVGVLLVTVTTHHVVVPRHMAEVDVELIDVVFPELA